MKFMLCTLVDEPFDEKGWLFEIKWDGYRAFGQKSRTVSLISRGGKSFNEQFPTIVSALKTIQGSFVIDGEIVVLDEGGVSHFQMLQNYYKRKVGTPYFYAFDLLELNGQDLRKRSLIERKKLLKALIRGQKTIRYSSHVLTEGQAFFHAAEKKGLEGVIAKRCDSPYQGSRTRDWLKIKTKNRQEVVIGGFTAPRGERKKFGALLIGVYEKGKLKYAGHVGGGFTHQLLIDVYQDLKKVICEKSPFTTTPKPNASVTWVKPKLVCEVEFTEWTADGKLRHPIFKGMRYDKPAKKVVREWS